MNARWFGVNESFLLVDDDPRVLKTFARNLRVEGCTVFTASRGAEALEIYAQEHPDVVVVDVRMPGMDGLAVLRALRERDPEADVILSSGHGEKDAVIAALRAGASDFVPKPIDRLAMASMVQRARERRRLRRELRAAQSALQTSESRYRTISQLTSDYAYAFQVSPDGSLALEWVTQAFTTITGFTPKEVEARGGWIALICPEDVPLTQERGARLLAGEPDVSEFRILTKYGEVRWLRDHGYPEWDAAAGRVVRIVGAAQDVTVRKLAEQELGRYSNELEGLVRARTAELRASEARYRTLVDNLPLSIGVASVEGSILAANPAMLWTLGYTLETLQGMNVDSFYRYPEQRVALLEQLRREGQVRNFETELVRRDGTPYHARALVTPITYAGQDALLTVLEDVTEQKHVQAALRESEETFRSVVEQSHDAIVLADAGGHVVLWNGSAERIFGLPRREVLGEFLWEVQYRAAPEERRSPENRARIRAMMRELFTAHTAPWLNQLQETQIQRPDGARRFIQTLIFPLEAGGDFMVGSIVRDVTAQRQAEAALRRRERQYRELVENVNSIILRLDTEGRITFCNAFARRFFGYHEEELLGQPLLGALVPLQDRDGRDLSGLVDEILRDPEAYATHENENLCRNGERVWIAWANRVIRDDDGRPVEILSVGNDITARKMAMEDLRKLLRAVEQSSSTVVITDVRGGIEYVNPQFARVTGYDPEDVIGQTPNILQSGAHSQAFYDTLWATISAGEVWRGEFLNRRKDGGHFWELASIAPVRNEAGDIAHFVKVAEDITDRKRMEQALRESERTARALLDATPDVALLVDRAGTILAANQPMAEAVHMTVDQLVGRDVYELFPEPLGRARREQAERVFRTTEVMRYEEVNPVSGKVTYNSLYPILDGDGEVMRLAIFAQDITDRKRMERQLREYAEHLEQRVAEKVGELERERAKMVQMDKMAALGQMATGVAHELNQPLTAISFEIDYLELLARQADEAARPFQMATDAVRELAENLRGDVARCRRLIDHLRDFGRASGGEAVPVDLNGPIEDSLILVGARLREHGVDVQLDLAEVLPPVAADANRLEQVFLNLISNAEHALEAASEDAPPEWHKVLALATRRQGGQVVAEVRDNGCGIPTELQPHIFEPFFTTKPVGEGTGLGLSISYGIVTELGGEITFESAEGKGTTFLLRFPVLA